MKCLLLQTKYYVKMLKFINFWRSYEAIRNFSSQFFRKLANEEIWGHSKWWRKHNACWRFSRPRYSNVILKSLWMWDSNISFTPLWVSILNGRPWPYMIWPISHEYGGMLFGNAWRTFCFTLEFPKIMHWRKFVESILTSNNSLTAISRGGFSRP